MTVTESWHIISVNSNHSASRILRLKSRSANNRSNLVCMKAIALILLLMRLQSLVLGVQAEVGELSAGQQQENPGLVFYLPLKPLF